MRLPLMATWRQGIRDRQPVVQAFSDGRIAEPNTSPPVADGQRLAVMSQPPVGPPVARLLRACGPAAVGRRVRAVVVDAVKLMSARRTSAHVANEGSEILAPLVAHSDSASAVAVELGVVSIVAARFCGRPHPVFGHRASAMNCQTRSRGLVLQATATADASTPQVFGAHQCYSAAVASASPHGFAVGALNAVRGHESPKPLAGQIDYWAAHV